MAKIQITIDDKLLTRVDAAADDYFMSRSGFISQAVVQYLNQFEAMSLIKEMSFSMKKIADSQCVDVETMKKLEDFERLTRMFDFK